MAQDCVLCRDGGVPWSTPLQFGSVCSDSGMSGSHSGGRAVMSAVSAVGFGLAVGFGVGEKNDVIAL